MVPTLDNEKWIQSVLSSSSAQVSIKHLYGLDIAQYEWVKNYVRDKKSREKAERLRNQITKIQQAPIHSDEVASIFKSSLKTVKQSVVENLKAHLRKVQAREIELFHGLDVKMLSTFALNQLSTSEINEILSVLETGKTQQEIEEAVKSLTNEITQLQEKINTELNIQSRWIHFDSGWPVPYPKGCRWTIFANDWKKVASRFDGKVDLEGCALETSAEHMAYNLLELDKVYKRTPLRKPRKK